MKRVAVCSYWYPPTQTIASLRIGKFVKYLPEYGWEPFVFTVAPRTDRYTRAGTLPDEGLPGHVDRIGDPSVHAVVDRLWPTLNRAGAVPRARDRWRLVRGLSHRAYVELLRFPDESWPWLLQYRRLRDAVARVRPDVIFSSSPPATTHLMARRLSSDLGIPWVADFRDPWSGNERLVRSTAFRSAESWLERRTLVAASAVTTVSASLRDVLVSLHDKPTYVVPNGFEAAAASRPARTSAVDDRAAFVYTGLIYTTTAVSLLFEALDQLVSGARIGARHLLAACYGRNQDVAQQALERYPRVRPLVELRGEVSHERSLEVQHHASALLLLEPPDRWAHGLTPGKLFEYLAAGRPIVATGTPGGEIDRLLHETRAGAVAATADQLAATIEALVEHFGRSGQLGLGTDPTAVAKYTRRAVTGQLAQVLDGVA